MRINLNVMILLALAGLLIFAFVVFVIKAKKYSWKRIFSKLKRCFVPRVWIVAASFALLLISVVGSFLMSKSNASAVITLNYSEASSAINTNKTRYDMNEIICDAVLEKALKKGAFEDVSVSDLSETLHIEPLSQGDSQDKDYYLISTQYLLSYEASSKTRKLDAENIVRLVSTAYKEYYIEKYAENFSIFTVDDNLSDYDYIDIVDFLSNQIYSMTDYLYQLSDREPGFIASNGETFHSVASKMYDLQGEMISNNLDSYIKTVGVSKNYPELIARLKYNNTLLDFDLQKERETYNTYNEAIKLYDEEMIRIVLVPSYDSNAEFYMSRTKVGIDDLSVRAQESSKWVSDYMEKMTKNQKIVDVMSTGSSGKSGAISKTDNLVDTTVTALKAYAAEARQIAQEYSKSKMNECIQYSLAGTSLFKLCLKGLAIGVLAYVILVMFVAAISYLKHPEMLSYYYDGAE